jgi:dipeptidyl aminopeptidase/acylaminoacyl peptidase
MPPDLTGHPTFREVEAFYRSAMEPGLGRPIAASEIDCDPASDDVLFTGLSFAALVGRHAPHVYRVSAGAGPQRVVPEMAVAPRYHPAGGAFALLVDHTRTGLFQPTLSRDLTRPVAVLSGSCEALEWFAAGDALLVLNAEPGADQSSAVGGMTAVAREAQAEAWMPDVRRSTEREGWRRAVRIDLATGQSHRLGPDDLTIWAALPVGSLQAIAVAGSDPREASWYSARIMMLGADGTARELYRPDYQIGALAWDERRGRLAFVEAPASDRGLVAGMVKVLAPGGDAVTLDTRGIDVSHCVWRGDGRLTVAGLRAYATVLAVLDPDGGPIEETGIAHGTCGLLQPDFALDRHGGIVAQYEAYSAPPVIRAANGQALADFAHDGSAWLQERCGRIEPLEWQSGDGTVCDGWLIRPHGPDRAAPLVMDVHGGPIWAARDMWFGKGRLDPMLLPARGYAVFLPNMRGSTGRGIAHQRAIVGTMGTTELQDFSSGLDHLIAMGAVDPERIGISGGSYGGFMACWLPVHDPRIRCAVAQSPVTYWPSQHWLTNIPHFDGLFLGGTPSDPTSSYGQRSPALHAARSRAATFVYGGRDDHCTPAEQIRVMAGALADAGTAYAYAIYPGEGHGVRAFPAVIDSSARTAIWFDRFLRGTA